jgi:hypothetical protein
MPTSLGDESSIVRPDTHQNSVAQQDNELKMHV